MNKDFYIRAFTQSTYRNSTSFMFEASDYMRINVRIVNCREEQVFTTISENQLIRWSMYQQGSSRPVNYTISQFFESSDDYYCPIIGYYVDNITDATTGKLVQNWTDNYFIGDLQGLDENGDEIYKNEQNYFKNLVVKNTFNVIERYFIYIRAYTGEISSDYLDRNSTGLTNTTNVITIDFSILKQPNEAP